MAPPTTGTSHGPATSSRQWWTLGLVSTATFMLLLDITVVGVALPSIQGALHASLPDLQRVIDAYTLVLAVLLLPAATLGDRLGRRRLFLAGLAVFTAGSLEHQSHHLGHGVRTEPAPSGWRLRHYAEGLWRLLTGSRTDNSADVREASGPNN